jgi:hypothetical protein
MMYLTGCRNPGVDPYLDMGVLGLLNTPNSGYTIREQWVYALDNGAFNAKTYVGDEKWFAWLESIPYEQRDRCLFATAPDVVGDHAATVERSTPWLPAIRALGYPAAFVAQDGITVDNTDWDTFDVLFIGGTNQFKLGSEAKAVIAHAQSLGKRVHCGRINSQKRFLAFAALGVDTADGTFLAFGSDRNLPALLSWVRHHDTHQPLFTLETP